MKEIENTLNRLVGLHECYFSVYGYKGLRLNVQGTLKALKEVSLGGGPNWRGAVSVYNKHGYVGIFFVKKSWDGLRLL